MTYGRHMNPLRMVFRRPLDEEALCGLLKRRRMRLPRLALNAWFPEADDVPVCISALPKGGWSSPVVDLVFLAKLVRLLKPHRMLELGSYRGYVARAIAEQMEADATLVALDVNPAHGEAYRGTDLAARIDRRVASISPEAFGEHELGSYDLIFLDADHVYQSVKHDTEVAIPLLAPSGVMVWHDYKNWGAFSKQCGVPEYLAELADSLPIVHLAGTGMAVYRPAWRDECRSDLEAMLETTRRWADEDAWQTRMPPG